MFLCCEIAQKIAWHAYFASGFTTSCYHCTAGEDIPLEGQYEYISFSGESIAHFYHTNEPLTLNVTDLD